MRALGGSETIYSASIAVTGGVQDYDLQTIISSSASISTVAFYNKVGNKKSQLEKCIINLLMLCGAFLVTMVA